MTLWTGWQKYKEILWIPMLLEKATPAKNTQKT